MKLSVIRSKVANRLNVNNIRTNFSSLKHQRPCKYSIVSVSVAPSVSPSVSLSVPIRLPWYIRLWNFIKSLFV